MRWLKFFSLKTLFLALGILLLLAFVPEQLVSQQTPSTPPVQTQATTPSQSPQASNKSAPASSESGSKASTNPRVTTSVRKGAEEQTVVDRSQLPEAGQMARPSLITQAVFLSLLSLLPFIIMILTSFLKIVVVLSLLRTALGVQQAPPNQIINGVAFLLSLFIMYPTVTKMYDAAQTVMVSTQAPDSILSPSTSAYVIEVASAAREPMRDFLKRNSSSKHQALFYRLIFRGLSEDHRATLKPDDFIVLVPSYITGQLKDAFEIGVLIYIPFFVIDLVTSNILLAMGMMMLSPVTISMPLKLFLLVMLDGWTILIEGLVKTFI
ncbi:MAG: type III secretion system export apparatus subunit SctR [Parachlamydiaceae bacterium]|nr:type III secretion system export apparatus subunit SctR [Parachlamydiaceae bacterium]